MGYDVTSKSTYNEASFKMARINRSQEILAIVNMDLFRWYDEFGGYGYHIKKTELYNLRSEVWGKMGTTEKEKLNKLFEMYDDVVKLKPVFVFDTINGIEGQRKARRLHEDNAIFMERVLSGIQMYINELLELAGYSTFTAEDDSGDPYN